MTLTFVGGMQAVMRYGWQEGRAAADRGLRRPARRRDRHAARCREAQALTKRLPLRIRIEGPVVNWSSHPDDRHDGPHARARGPPERLAPDARARRRPPHQLRPRRVAARRRAEDRARLIGWATLLAMLLLVAIVYTRVRRLLRPLADIRAGAIRYGAGDFSTPIPLRTRDELGELAQQVNGMADGLHALLDAKRQLLLAISHELRSPLTRAG